MSTYDQNGVKIGNFCLKKKENGNQKTNCFAVTKMKISNFSQNQNYESKEKMKTKKKQFTKTTAWLNQWLKFSKLFDWKFN